MYFLSEFTGDKRLVACNAICGRLHLCMYDRLYWYNVWSLVLVYVWSLVLVYVWSLVLVYVWSLVLVYVWSLVDPPALPLIYYGKREVLAVISSMEGDYNAILDWRSSTGSVPPGVTMQWGSSIVIAGEVKRIHGSKRKSFMADMYGFANDGELQAIKAYLLSHGNFEIEQVTLQGGGYSTCPFGQST